MARQIFLDYVWKYCIEPQLGYSFSLNHTLPYSLIAVQEMNLATRWNPLYWQCACLCVNAGSFADDMDEEDDEELEEPTEALEASDKEDQDATEETKTKRVAPDYRKIAKAISDAQRQGVIVELPDINTAQVDFIPDVKNNSILYSLQAVNVVGDDLMNRIISNRPYVSVEDFINKVAPTPVQMIGLIKAGCFDKLYTHKTRLYIMNHYLQLLADKEIPLKDKLTSVQIKKALELKIDLPEYQNEIRVFKFKKFIDAQQIDKSAKRYVLTDDQCVRFFNMFFVNKLNLAKSEYGFLPDNSIFVKQTALTKVYEELTAPLFNFFNSEEGRKQYQKLLQQNFIDQYFNKYCQGTCASWEMETMCYYYSNHELAKVNSSLYNIKDFFSLPTNTNNPEMCSIVGTVIGTNNIRHTVSLLTPSGVLDVKFYRNTFVTFNSKISVVDPQTKQKTVLDESWFKRGTKLIIYGFRKDNMFHARSSKVPVWTQGVGKIEQIHDDGSLTIRHNRVKKT